MQCRRELLILELLIPIIDVQVRPFTLSTFRRSETIEATLTFLLVKRPVTRECRARVDSIHSHSNWKTEVARHRPSVLQPLARKTIPLGCHLTIGTDIELRQHLPTALG